MYFCVLIPEFPAQVLLRLRPELAALPAVVVAGDPPLEQVCSLNALAGRLGAAPGMTRGELEEFSGVQVLRRSFAEERSARDPLLETAWNFTPRVEVHAPGGTSFAMVLDMTGTERLFGTAEQCAARVVEAFHALRFHVQLAGSANFEATLCLAPSARANPVVLAAGEEPAYLRRLPVAALTITPQQSEMLALWGIRTLGELAALPEEDLVTRMGQEGKRLRLLARGEHQHLMVPEEPAFTLEEFVEFDFPVESLDSLLFVLGPMLDQLIARAGNRALAIAGLHVKLGLEGGSQQERTLKPALPVVERKILLRLLQLDLQAHLPGAGVVCLRVQAEAGTPSKVQAGLFAPPLPEPLRLDVTLARIAAIVGEGRLGRPRLLDTHRPDSFAMEGFVVPTGAVASNALPSRATVALRRCRPPVPLHMQQAVRTEGKRPAAFSLKGKQYVVQEAYGPWRRSGDWWAREIWSCEEWDLRAVAKEEMLLCLAVHDLLQDHWRMEALYD